MLTVPQIRQRLSTLLTWDRGAMPFIEDGLCCMCAGSLFPVDEEGHEGDCPILALEQLLKELT